MLLCILQIPGEHRVLAANSPKDVSIDEAEAAFDTSDAAAKGTVIVRCS